MSRKTKQSLLPVAITAPMNTAGSTAAESVSPPIVRPLPAADPMPDGALWRSLKYFSYYRLTIATVFLVAITFSDGALNVGSQDPRLFYRVCILYVLVAVTALFVLTRWQRAFHLQLSVQVVADLLLLCLLLFASGGAKSGIATMLLVVLVGAGLVGQGRMVLFYAAFATVLLLLEQSYRVLAYHGESGDFFRTGLTSIGFFGSAMAARLLARRVVANEQLARRRGIELADQIRINERVIRDMEDGVLVIDTVGRVRLSNPQAAVLLGAATPFARTLVAYSPALAREFLAHRARAAETELLMEIPRNGRSLKVRLLPPEEGGNTLIYLEDIGRLQQEARQAKLAALGRLTANMAHEIRNPLAAISHAAELIAEEPPGTGMQRLTRIIGDNTQRLNRLVIEVMELGRRDRANPEPLDLRLFLSHLVEELSLHQPAAHTRIAIDLPSPCPICFDRAHLHRVLSNLLTNALHFSSPQPGAIHVSGTDHPAESRFDLHLTDDGPGIAENERQQIFEPFFTTRKSGTGLGLYIARELSEANGARLSLLDPAPGAHFCLSLPACKDPIPHPP